jgi:hypothetical protein
LGCVPPVGSHCNVQRSAFAPGRGVTSITSETLAAAALGAAEAADPPGLADPPELAGPAPLPHAATAAAHSAVERTYRALECARRKESLMVI